MRKTMNIEEVFNYFCEKLKDREREGFLSEDNIRFYWFAAMLNQDSELNHYSLEKPYPQGLLSEDGKKELDLMYDNGTETMKFEIKFHRKGDDNSSKNSPRTQAAGNIFNDLLRLQTLKGNKKEKKQVRYFFLYVNDNEMHDYLSTGRKKTIPYMNLLQSFYAEKGLVPVQNNLNIFKNNTPDKFWDKAIASTGTNWINVNLKLLYKKSFHSESQSLSNVNQNGVNCHVRLYEL